MSARRARTRRLIERGGLVAKSGLEAVIARHQPDTAPVLLGALLELAEALRTSGDDAVIQAQLLGWQARGLAALRASAGDTDVIAPVSGAAE